MTCPLTNKVVLGVLWKFGGLSLLDGVIRHGVASKSTIRHGVAGKSTTSTATPLYGLFSRLLCMLIQQQYKVVKLLGRGVIVNIGFVI